MIGTGPSSLGVPGVPWHTQYLADQLTLFQPGGTDYAHLITTGTPHPDFQTFRRPWYGKPRKNAFEINWNLLG